MQFSANLVFLFRNLALPAADIQGDLLNSVTRFADKIGHIQFAAVPDRSEPDHGEVDYSWLLRAIADAGYGCIRRRISSRYRFLRFDGASGFKTLRWPERARVLVS
jgi:hypothetical protein